MIALYKKRIPLGTLCKFNRGYDGSTDEVVTVVGCWRFVERKFPSRASVVRDKHPGLDPNEAEGFTGYLLLPSKGGKYICAAWADADLGDLKPLFLRVAVGLSLVERESDAPEVQNH